MFNMYPEATSNGSRLVLLISSPAKSPDDPDLVRAAVSNPAPNFATTPLARRTPDLIQDDSHHEQKVDSKRPEHGEFGTLEVAPGDGMLLGPN